MTRWLATCIYGPWPRGFTPCGSDAHVVSVGWSFRGGKGVGRTTRRTHVRPPFAFSYVLDGDANSQRPKYHRVEPSGMWIFGVFIQHTCSIQVRHQKARYM